MELMQQILFVLLTITAVWFFTRKTRELKRNIDLGRAEDFSERSADRWKNVLLLAFGQKKMFRNPLVAIMHFVIYAGFIIINLEVLGNSAGWNFWNTSTVCCTHGQRCIHF